MKRTLTNYLLNIPLPEGDLTQAQIDAVEKAVQEYLSGKVLIDRKQLSERILEIDKPSNGYGEVCEQNRQYRILLKELLLVEVSAKTKVSIE